MRNVPSSPFLFLPSEKGKGRNCSAISPLAPSLILMPFFLAVIHILADLYKFTQQIAMTAQEVDKTPLLINETYDRTAGHQTLIWHELSSMA